MRNPFFYIFTIACFCTAHGNLVAQPVYQGQPKNIVFSKRKDQLGDPLPLHALARFGSVRYRIAEPTYQVGMPANGKYFVVATIYGLRKIDAQTGLDLPIKSPKFVKINEMALSPDGKILAMAGNGNSLQLWNVDTAKSRQLLRLKNNRHRVRRLHFSRDGKYLLVGVTGYFRQRIASVYVFDVANGKQVRMLNVVQNQNTNLVLSANGKHVATYGLPSKRSRKSMQKYGRMIQVWDFATGKEIRRLQTEKANITAVAISIDGRWLVGESAARELHIWNIESGKEHKRLTGLAGVGERLTFSPGGNFLIAGHDDGTVQIWNTKTWQLHKTSKVECAIRDFIFPNENTILAYGLHKQSLCLWNPLTGKNYVPQDGHQSFVKGVTFSADQKQLLSVDYSGRFCRWRIADKKRIETFRLLDLTIDASIDNYQNVAFSPGGKYVAVQYRTNPRTVGLWHIGNRKLIRTWDSNTTLVTNSLQFSPDGKHLAVLDKDSVVDIYQVPSGKHLRRLAIRTAKKPASVAYSQIVYAPNGKYLAAVCRFYDNGKRTYVMHVVAWDTTDGSTRLRIKQPFAGNAYAAFSHDSAELTVNLNRGQVHVFKTETGKEHRQFPYGIDYARFGISPDGRFTAGDVFFPFRHDHNVISSVYLRESVTGKIRCKLTGHTRPLSALQFSADGSLLVTGSEDTTLLLWDLSGKSKHQASPPPIVKEMTKLWQDIASTNGQRVFSAIGKMAAHPKESLPWFEKHLQPDTRESLTKTQVKTLIAELDSERFRVREKALVRLRAGGSMVLPQLQAALKKKTSLEVRQRLEKLIRTAKSTVPTPENLQQLRAIEILERVGNDRAQRLLTRLANGTRGALLTEQSRQAIARMKQ